MIHTVTYAFLGSLIALFACAPAATTPRPVTSPQRDDAVPRNLEVNEWKPVLKTGSYSYTIHDSALISIGSDTTHTIPIETTTFLSLITNPHGDSIQLNGEIDSLFHTSSHELSRDMTVGSELSLWLKPTGRLQDAPIQARSDCSKISNTSQIRISEFLLSYPAQLIKPGSVWTDTITTNSCHGKAALFQQSTREFELVELTTWNNHRAAKIRRTIISTTSSPPDMPNDRLSATGGGSSSSILYVDLTSGMLLESSGHSESRFTVTTSRGVFPFLQTTDTEIKESR